MFSLPSLGIFSLRKCLDGFSRQPANNFKAEILRRNCHYIQICFLVVFCTCSEALITIEGNCSLPNSGTTASGNSTRGPLTRAALRNSTVNSRSSVVSMPFPVGSPSACSAGRGRCEQKTKETAVPRLHLNHSSPKTIS